jgi:hypothetical protein
MQAPNKTNRQFILFCRTLRDIVPPGDQSVPAQTSPALIFTASVLALLLVILEIDLHRVRLYSMGVVSDRETVEPFFMSP